MDIEKLRQLYLKIRDVNNLSQKNFSQYLEEKEITPVQYGVLMILSNNDAVTMTKLYTMVGCVPSNMTSLINRMVRDDLVRTTKNPNDQRQTLVYLTEKGEAFQKDLLDLYHSFLKDNFRALREDEHDQLLELLYKLEKSLING